MKLSWPGTEPSEGGRGAQALAAGDFASLSRLAPDPVDARLQLRDDLDPALARLREVHGKYRDQDWRREHRGDGRYPENELREAAEAYLGLIEASRSGKPPT